MDFDASQFLAVNISVDERDHEISQDTENEDQDSPLPGTEKEDQEKNESPAKEKIVVTGGLQLEPVELPVPRFDTLFANVREMIENNYGPMNAEGKDTFEVAVPGGNENSSGVPSEAGPSHAGRANSPDRIRKCIPTTYSENRFRRDVFCGEYERVKLFRLHCTSCDRHLGCAPGGHLMRTHKLLQVGVCRSCSDFYGNRTFPVEDGNEIYCCWCGEGGELYCCSTCPKTVCKRCAIQNFGLTNVKQIEDNENWQCFVCKPDEIYPHRAILWAWQHLTKRMRQIITASTEERNDVLFLKDSSHCCTDDPIETTSIVLPSKEVMNKIPHCLIASVHLPTVKAQPDRLEAGLLRTKNKTVLNSGSSMSGSTMSMPINRVVPQQSSTARQLVAPNQNRQVVPRTQILLPPSMLNQQLQRTTPLSHQQAYRNSVQFNRSRPYPSPMPYRPPEMARPNHHLSHRMTALEPIQTPDQNQNFPHHSNAFAGQSNSLNVALPQTVDLVGEDSPSGTDISWLERGIAGIKECINPIKLQLNQFTISKDDLKNDFGNLSNFVERLSYNVKIAICKLAKINSNLQDAKKQALDNQVASVVNELGDVAKMPGSVAIFVKSPATAASAGTTAAPSKTPGTPTPSTSKEEELGLNPALLCETVMESEVMNDHVVKDANIKKRAGHPRKQLKDTPGTKVILNIRENLISKIRKKTLAAPPPTVFDLSDDEENPQKEFNAALCCKKFKIDPCYVELKRCDG